MTLWRILAIFALALVAGVVSPWISPAPATFAPSDRACAAGESSGPQGHADDEICDHGCSCLCCHAHAPAKLVLVASLEPSLAPPLATDWEQRDLPAGSTPGELHPADVVRTIERPPELG